MNRSADKLRIIVGGYLGLLPAGGVTWDYLQYPLGFAELGHDVFYIEDTRLWPVYQSASGDSSDCSAMVDHLAAVMDAFGLGDRWAYRDEASGCCFGMTNDQVDEVCGSADVLVNVSCSTAVREPYLRIPTRILIDSDPMFTQIQHQNESNFTGGRAAMEELFDAHTHHFTFGENFGASDCLMPSCGLEWLPTRQPICLSHWSSGNVGQSSAQGFTTVMNWSAAPEIEFAGRLWGQKNVEFMKVISLPQQVPGTSLTVAVGQTQGNSFPRDEALAHRWKVVDPELVAGDWQRYRNFIHDSEGEFSVAKHTYVEANTGWFSCRSACYLAAGKPVVTQDTGWSRYLPEGTGLLSFSDCGQAAEAIGIVRADPVKHSLAARQIAEECFDSRKVLSDLLHRAGVG